MGKSIKGIIQACIKRLWETGHYDFLTIRRAVVAAVSEEQGILVPQYQVVDNVHYLLRTGEIRVDAAGFVQVGEFNGQ